MLKYKLIRTGMALLALLFLAAVLLIPAMEVLRGKIFTWLLYGVYLLVVVFVWSIGSKNNRDVGRDFDAETGNRELDGTKEVLRERSRWNTWNT